MMQAFEKLSTVSIKDTNGTVVTTADNPTTLHTRSDLQWNITADGVVKRLHKGGRNTRRDVGNRVRVDAVKKVRDQERTLILREGCVSTRKNVRQYSSAPTTYCPYARSGWDLRNPFLTEWFKIICDTTATSIPTEQETTAYVHLVAFQKENDHDFATIAK